MTLTKKTLLKLNLHGQNIKKKNRTRRQTEFIKPFGFYKSSHLGRSVKIMNIEDLIKDTEKYYMFKDSIKTILGDFTIELRLYDCLPPDQKVLELARELRDRFLEEIDLIHDLVYQSYKVAESDKDWMDICSLPTGLSKSEIISYLHNKIMYITKDPNEDDLYRSKVYIEPIWDIEHGLRWELKNNRWKEVDC